jgi:hypothetical protein
MTARQMQSAFEHGVNRIDSERIVESHVVFHWINDAIERFVATRYSGNNAKKTAVEDTQKRTEDLRTLVKEVVLATTLDLGSLSPGTYSVELPSDYRYKLSEYVGITYVNVYTNNFEIKTFGVTECTSDTIIPKLHNPYSEHILVYEEAKPLRLFKGNTVQLFTDDTYSVDSYILRYIKKPVRVGLGPIDSDCDLPEQSHTEIIDLAVSLFLENVGDPRYPTQKSELIMNE